MKIEIVKFDNDLYGVRRRMFFGLDEYWLCGRCFRHFNFPSRDCYFQTFKEAEDAVQAYKVYVKARADTGRVIKKVKA